MRDRFFQKHCKLFHHRPFVWHIRDGRRNGFHALVNEHWLAGPDDEGRRTLEAFAYNYLGRSELDGNRSNDLHYTNGVKRAARERADAEAGRV